jgi:peptidoglycan/LPS O-acetylase OafA/YrhL
MFCALHALRRALAVTMLRPSLRLAPGRLAEYVLAGGLVLVLALVLVIAGGHLTRTSDVLAFLLAVIGFALAGCAAPGRPLRRSRRRRRPGRSRRPTGRGQPCSGR